MIEDTRPDNQPHKEHEIAAQARRRGVRHGPPLVHPALEALHVERRRERDENTDDAQQRKEINPVEALELIQILLRVDVPHDHSEV